MALETVQLRASQAPSSVALAAARIDASLKSVAELVTGAMTAAGDPGDYGGRLLRSALPLIKRVRREIEPCTSDAMHRALDLVYDLQGVVKGAAAFATLDGHPARASLAEQADGLLESMTEQMDNLNFWPAAGDLGDDDFNRGRDLAAAMLRAGEALWNTDGAAERRWHREGRVQNRFATAYLSKLSEEPSLIEGFSAVLSARLGTGEAISASSFLGLPRAEFEAGELGADGTVADENATGCGATSNPVDLAGDAICHVREAAAVISAAADNHSSAVIHGLDDLVGLAVKATEEAEPKDAPRERMEYASAQLEIAIAVLDLVNDEKVDDMLLYAGGSLLAMSKRSVDARIEARHG